MPLWSKREDEVEERVEPLNDAERAWVAGMVDAARAVLKDTGIRQDGEIDAESLDELWAQLRSEPQENPNDAINLVGLAFGQVLVDRFGLEWAVVTDKQGTEIAVRGPSAFTVFPTNFLGKRYESGDTGFLAPFADHVGDTLRKLT